MTNEEIDWEKIKLRNRGKETIDYLVGKGVEVKYEQRIDETTTKQSLKTKRRNGLFSIGRTDLYQRMDQCTFGDNGQRKYKGVCGNVYCKGCRNQLSYQYYSMLWNRIECGRWIVEDLTTTTPLGYTETSKSLERSEYTNDDLLHITGVCGLSTLRPNDIQKVMKDDQKKWRRIRYNIDKQTDEHFWIESVYEYELVNWIHLEHSDESDYKKKQIKQLIENYDKRFFNEPFLFIHFHGITNIPRDRLNDVFGYLYYINGQRLIKTSKETGLYVQKLHSTKTLSENLKKMCSYPFKDPYRYKHSFRGNDFLSGEYFTDEELGKMIELYDHIGGRGHRKLFRSVSNELVLWERVYQTLNNELIHQSQRFKRWRKKRSQILPFVLILHRILSEIRKPKNGDLRQKTTSVISELMRSIFKGTVTDDKFRYVERLNRLKWEVNDKLFHRRKFEWDFVEPNKTKSKYQRKYEYYNGWREKDRLFRLMNEIKDEEYGKNGCGTLDDWLD